VSLRWREAGAAVPVNKATSHLSAIWLDLRRGDRLAVAGFGRNRSDADAAGCQAARNAPLGRRLLTAAQTQNRHPLTHIHEHRNRATTSAHDLPSSGSGNH
jgi:hypothetical protein